MTQYGDPDPNGLAAAVPPGEAPLFGFVPDAPFEAVPERAPGRKLDGEPQAVAAEVVRLLAGEARAI